MLRGNLIHPDILETLGRSGHGSKVLIADGNYPFRTKLGPNARAGQLKPEPGTSLLHAGARGFGDSHSGGSSGSDGIRDDRPLRTRE